ncbi:hypothetical protein ACF3MZ_16780 [Paenibacillaceae bacterium WGS1546]|uniref:hypothetical protein n=1 Tax=Cohnella sp. WGS1546 TaxID=3366810 RepID=UPI00372CFE61
MLKAVDVNLDTNEMVLKVEKEKEPTRIGYYKLDRLVMVKGSVRKLFRKVEVKGIQVHVNGPEGPFVITSDQVGDYDLVENHLLKLAEKYDVQVTS